MSSQRAYGMAGTHAMLDTASKSSGQNCSHIDQLCTCRYNTWPNFRPVPCVLITVLIPSIKHWYSWCLEPYVQESWNVNTSAVDLLTKCDCSSACSYLFIYATFVSPQTMTTDERSLAELMQQMVAIHRSLQGVAPSEAELQYLIEARQLDSYGTEFYPTKVQSQHLALSA